MSKQVVDQQQNKKNRKIILGIFGIPALVLVLSSILYYLVDSKVVDLGTVNNGQLIVPPLQFTQLPLATVSGEVFDYSQPEPRWAYVIVGDRNCAGSCEQMLYIARQSIIALAKRMDRVRLIFISTDGDISVELQQRFDKEYRGIDVLALSRDSIRQLFAGAALNPFEEKQFLVIDPRGWVMMYYRVDDTEQQTLAALGKAVVRDMKRLIK